jgi:glycosyltransferase involved in cell wall biosynthesis
MVVGAYYPELAGGSLQCRTLALALKDRVTFTVLTTTTLPDAPAQSEVDGIQVHRVFVDSRSRRSKVMAAFRMMRLAPRLARQCDIFHFHGFTEKMVLLFAAATLFGTRTMEKMTSLGWDDPISIRSRPFGRLLAAVQARADRIVAVTPALRERCLRAGIPAARVTTIPNGVDTERFAPVDAAGRALERRRLGLPPDVPLVTFIGFWSVEKGPHRVFDAWERARQTSGIDAALLFIGSTDASHAEVDSALVEDVRRRVADGQLGSRVIFVEQTTDVAAYLRASDIFAVPSSREGMSNALLEAMASGLPAIAGAIPGVGESVIDFPSNGYLVPPDDRTALADILAQLFLDPQLRADVGCRARRATVERFAMPAIADRYLALYSELAGAGAQS